MFRFTRSRVSPRWREEKVIEWIFERPFGLKRTKKIPGPLFPVFPKVNASKYGAASAWCESRHSSF